MSAIHPQRFAQVGRRGPILAERIPTVDVHERVHFLPVANQTAHDLTPGCWCEPEIATFIPEHAFDGESYKGWFHHEAN